VNSTSRNIEKPAAGRALAPFPLVALALAALAAGVWGGLARFGWSLPGGKADLAELHGPLMVFGFLGTVVSLERAVALARPWGYLAPAGTLAGAGLLLAGVRQGIGELVLLLAGFVLASLFVVVVRAHPTPPPATLLVAALLWVAGDALWLDGSPLVEVVPWWVGFLVLTIVAERLELAALGGLTGAGRVVFAALALCLLAGLVVATTRVEVGARVAGAALLGYALWLLRFDIARRTLRRPGLPRFVALSLLPGYLWLLVAGILWLRYGAPVAGPARDAALHAIFVGFVFSMIFGHAPVIFPGVLRVRIPFRRVFYVHLALLHAALALRVAGDLAGDETLASRAAVANATAVALFVAVTLGSAAVSAARRVERRTAACGGEVS
jgi:hypothetical protein